MTTCNLYEDEEDLITSNFCGSEEDLTISNFCGCEDFFRPLPNLEKNRN